MPTSFAQFWLDKPASVKPLDLLEISHPNFTDTYRIVRNKIGGCTATIDGVSRSFTYYPLRITPKSARANLDYGEQIDLGDLGDIVGDEIDAIAAADGYGTKPTVRRWIFSSANLVTPVVGPITLEIPAMPMQRIGTSFVAQAPSLNMNRTGEPYLLARFSGLAGFV
jgi:hypothetical protein